MEMNLPENVEQAPVTQHSNLHGAIYSINVLYLNSACKKTKNKQLSYTAAVGGLNWTRSNIKLEQIHPQFSSVCLYIFFLIPRVLSFCQWLQAEGVKYLFQKPHSEHSS